MRAIAALDEALLRGRPLPQPGDGGKDERGAIAVIGGSREVPGAAFLAGLGALRAGAGKLRVATTTARAAALAVALPEALVMELPETDDGDLASECWELLASRLSYADAILFGPGMSQCDDTHVLMGRLAAHRPDASLIVDAGALCGLSDHRDALLRREKPAVLTPHAGEMANMLGVKREEIEAEPLRAARDVAEKLNAVVAMKGAKTHVVGPDGEVFLYQGGGVGLGTSGSGDVLAGVIAGLAARGASPLDATLWGVFLHGEAGAVLGETVGTLGFLAREILPEVPRVLMRFEG
ncbi:MAG: NAD(P)H-hydrate dehydratase [Methylobacterium mesophilicum]|nr:NAD(P)H-hydrate dehydratase [Methylobacterium mesophilicum]